MKERKPINLSWLVEKWTLIDEDTYLKNMWLNTESLDFIRINKEIQTNEDIDCLLYTSDAADDLLTV